MKTFLYNNCNAKEDRERKDAFTLIEILSVIAVIAILLMILVPAIESVRVRALDAKCISNLRSLHSSMIIYANEHQGRLSSITAPITAAKIQAFTISAVARIDQSEVDTSGYATDLLPYVSDYTVFLSPTDDTTYKLKYGPHIWAGIDNQRDLKISDFSFPSRQIIAHQRNPTNPDDNHVVGQALNAVFVDGRASKFLFYRGYNKKTGAADPHWFNSAASSDRGQSRWFADPTTSWDAADDPGYWTD